MNRQSEEMRRELDQIFEAFPYIRKEDIPGIDLYMDQVTTFLQRNLSGLSRDPDGDKFLTKTMINNYVKNKVLIPPVKKKYSRDHLMLLILIYYLKSFLSIGDIRSAISPVMECYASSPEDPAERKKEAQSKKKERAERTASREERQQRAEKGNRKPAEQHVDPAGTGQGLGQIYDRVIKELHEGLPGIRKDIEEQIEYAENDFALAPEEDRPMLQRFSLICRLSSEIYVRKLFIEKLLDSGE